jgi:hypothetical protein
MHREGFAHKYTAVLRQRASSRQVSHRHLRLALIVFEEVSGKGRHTQRSTRSSSSAKDRDSIGHAARYSRIHRDAGGVSRSGAPPAKAARHAIPSKGDRFD